MAARIETAQGKVSYVVLGYVFGISAAIALGVTVGWLATSVVCGVYLLAWVGLGARTFRGDNESLATPRAWWRMTAGPASGFALAAVFLGQAAYLGLTSAQRPEPQVFPALAATNALVAVAYLHSSVRLRGAVSTVGS